jgi:putative membrane protein
MQKPTTNRWRGVIRTLVIWAVEVVALFIMAWLMPSVTLVDLRVAVVFIAAVGILNALLWPLLSRVTLRFIVYTLGLFSLLLNGLIFWLAAQFVDGIQFDSFWSALWLAIGVSVISTIFSALLTIDDDSSYFRNVLQRQARRHTRHETLRSYPMVVFLEIDGCCEKLFRRAIDTGNMPNMKRWLESGSHRIVPWETDLSCQTGGCQAGILHGNNNNMPAFRWVEKEQNNKIMTSTGPWDAPVIEQRISNGQGLLAAHGRSRSNLFTGDAEDATLTYSHLTNLGKLYTPAYYIFFSNPYNFIRCLVLVVAEMLRERRERRWAVRENVQPRLDHHRRGLYPLVRAITTVVLQEMTIYTLIGDVFLGQADAIYATFVGYDEVAHHSGIEDPGALQTLTRLDRGFARVERAAQDADRPVQLVVLSDHGQSKGATFLQRYGLTLEQHIRSLLPADVKVHAQLETNEGWTAVSAVMTDAIQDDNVVSKVVQSATQKYTQDGQVIVGPEYERRQDEQTGEVVKPEDAQIIVLASGNLGLVYFTDWQERVSYEHLQQVFPNLIAGLVNHPGIGFIMVHSAEQGAMVIGAKGVYYLEGDRIEGENPLAGFHPRTAHHLRRTDSFEHVPDILVNSFYDATLDEGCAFEELIGFHGGVGGTQSHPFLFVPAEWPLPEDEIVGAENVYHYFKSQLTRLKGEAVS